MNMILGMMNIASVYVFAHIIAKSSCKNLKTSLKVYSRVLRKCALDSFKEYYNRPLHMPPTSMMKNNRKVYGL